MKIVAKLRSFSMLNARGLRILLKNPSRGFIDRNMSVGLRYAKSQMIGVLLQSDVLSRGKDVLFRRYLDVVYTLFRCDSCSQVHQQFKEMRRSGSAVIKLRSFYQRP